MPSPSIHQGRVIRRMIEGLGISIRDFSRQHGFCETQVRRWLKAPTLSILGHNLVRLAQALGKTREELEGRLGIHVEDI